MTLSSPHHSICLGATRLPVSSLDRHDLNSVPIRYRVPSSLKPASRDPDGLRDIDANGPYASSWSCAPPPEPDTEADPSTHTMLPPLVASSTSHFSSEPSTTIHVGGVVRPASER